MCWRLNKCHQNDTQYLKILQHFRKDDLFVYKGVFLFYMWFFLKFNVYETVGIKHVNVIANFHKMCITTILLKFEDVGTELKKYILKSRLQTRWSKLARLT